MVLAPKYVALGHVEKHVMKDAPQGRKRERHFWNLLKSYERLVLIQLLENLGLEYGMTEYGAPWTRVHVELVHSGRWAGLLPCSRSVYLVLAALSDNRLRVTLAGLEKVSRLAGLSPSRTMVAYRELRDHGLIWRQRISLNGHRPYLSGLCNPYKWVSLHRSET